MNEDRKVLFDEGAFRLSDRFLMLAWVSVWTTAEMPSTPIRSLDGMWTYAGEPQVWDGTYPGGYDGIVFKYPLADGSRESFTVVMISRHANMKANVDPMSPRAERAIDTQGRSEVERYLADPFPARIIEVTTWGNPRATLRTDSAPAQAA